VLLQQIKPEVVVRVTKEQPDTLNHIPSVIIVNSLCWYLTLDSRHIITDALSAASSHVKRYLVSN
jgi:hypothetical protein